MLVLNWFQMFSIVMRPGEFPVDGRTSKLSAKNSSDTPRGITFHRAWDIVPIKELFPCLKEHSGSYHYAPSIFYRYVYLFLYVEILDIDAQYVSWCKGENIYGWNVSLGPTLSEYKIRYKTLLSIEHIHSLLPFWTRSASTAFVFFIVVSLVMTTVYFFTSYFMLLPYALPQARSASHSRADSGFARARSLR